ncbi:uncharacterized protein [Temnothorax longispinosus]|uniref:uncharacterized protein n=1 Tax=Temnothorax longispinosus TaxID=300112 RepID=UPI003A99BC6F
MVAGDFNAKSTLWGSPRTDWRGDATERWAAGLGLCLANVGRESTCVRRRGELIVDITWATPPVARDIRGWRVVSDVETLSDHQLIEMVVQASPPGVLARRLAAGRTRRRWALKQMNVDLFKAAIIGSAWIPEEDDISGAADVDVDAMAEGMVKVTTQACDVAMPRQQPLPPRKQTY